MLRQQDKPLIPSGVGLPCCIAACQYHHGVRLDCGQASFQSLDSRPGSMPSTDAPSITGKEKAR